MATIDINLNNETGDDELTIIHTRNGELIQQFVVSVENVSSVSLSDVQSGDTIHIG